MSAPKSRCPDCRELKAECACEDESAPAAAIPTCTECGATADAETVAAFPPGQRPFVAHECDWDAWVLTELVETGNG